MQDILNKAYLNNYAIPQFNINNLEWTRFILEECQRLKSPVILGVSESAIKYIGGFQTVFNMVTGLINDLHLSIPIVLHLDHGSSFTNCKQAIMAGFTSVMIDASLCSIEKNIEMTNQVIDYASKFNATVEAEVGPVLKATDEVFYANINDVIEFVNKSKVTCLAVAVGSSHGVYIEKPKINLGLVNNIKKLTNIPLVLHGGSGIPDNLIFKLIKNGIVKINVNTELQQAWTKGVRKFLKENNEVYDPRIIIKSGEMYLKKVVCNKIMLFGSYNQA